MNTNQPVGASQIGDISERRRTARIRIHLFTVVRKILRSKGFSYPHIGFTRDISATGMYFYTRMRLRQGDHLSVTLHVVSDGAPGGPPPKLESNGFILRMDPIHAEIPLHHLNGVAMQFKHELAVTF